MNNYANAQNLASYGRGNDTQLVHMTPGEIKGLQDLALAHGGSLTINPNTGLPEAGFLEQILPVVIGAGLTIASGGALTPLMAAGITGAGYGLATGSVEKGLMAGLGAYGGAGLTGSLASLGGEAAAQAGQQAATKGFEAVSQEAVTAGSQEVAKEAAKTAALEGTTLPSNYADLYAKTGGAQEFTKEAAQKFLENPNNFDKLAPQSLQEFQSSLNAPGTNPQDVINAAGRAQGATGATTTSNISRGLKEVATSLPAAGDFVANNVGPMASLALPALAQSSQPKGPAGYQEDEYDRRLKGYKLSPDYQPYQAPRPNPYYRPVYAADGGVMGSYDDEAGSDTVGMASGGIASYRNKGQVNVLQDYLDRQESEEGKQKHLSTNPSSYFPDVGIFRDTDVDTAKKDALTASMIRLGKAGKTAGIKPIALPKTSIKGLGDVSGATPEIEEAADGGVMGYNLGGYSDGGRMLKGPGDGMSDSIPASIAGKQPARLADGEFVVPADVVSHLGNGSTDAGAKKLYGMMDKIRHARTGKKKQAPKVNVDKYLPGNKKASGGIAGYAEGGVIGFDEGGTTYSDAQVTQALAESMAQGFSLADSVQAGISNYGISQAQADKAAAIVNAYQEGLGRAPDPAGAAYWASSGLSASQIAAAIANSPEAQSNRTASTPNTSGGVYADATFAPAQIASYLVNNKVNTPAEISRVQNMFGVSSADMTKAQQLIASNDPSIAQATAAYNASVAARPSAVAENVNAVVTQIYAQQLGRAPDASGLQYWSNLLANGASPQSIAAGIAQSKEGQDMDIQSATSAYRQALGRNPEPAGMQYWLSVAQNEGLSSKQLQDRITAAASAEQTARNIAPGTKFTQMQLDALGANPYAGYYSEKSIYDIAPNAVNVSKIGDRQVQFTTPVTQQAVVSQFIDGIYTPQQGLEVLNTPHALAAINVAVANGTLKKSDYDRLVSDISNSKTAAEVRSALAKPQGQVVIDAAYGQQIGEAATLAEAQREAAQRQAVLTKIDPGYYLSNRTLTDAYQKAGVSTPFQYDFYKGVDTRDIKQNVVTPQNFTSMRDQLANQVRANPYRPEYDPINQNRTPLPASTRDPYSDEGLKVLYGNMMDQYGTRVPGQPNPAVVSPYNPNPYTPPPPSNLTLNTPIPDASKPATPAPDTSGPFGRFASDVAAAAPARAGGLMSIDRKKRAKTKPKKGLLAA